MTRINMSREDIKDPFAVLPDGTYTVRVAVALLEKSKKGDDMIQLQLKVTGGEPDDDEQDINDHLGKTIRDYMVVSGANAKYGQWRWLHYVVGAGLDVEDMEIEDVIGEEYEVDVKVTPPDPNSGFGEGNNITRVHVDEDLLKQ